MSAIRVVHLIPGEQWAGAEVQAVTLIKELRRAAVDARAIVFHRGKVATALERLGIDVTVIDQRVVGPKACLRRLTQRLQSVRPTVIHVHRYRETVLAAAALLQHAGPALVRTVHGLPEPYRGWKAVKMALYRGMEWAAIRMSRAVLIAVSADVGASVRRTFPHATVHVVPNGIDESRILPIRDRAVTRREWGISDDAPVIGFLGRLAPIKGADLFFQMALRLGREFPELHAVLVGEGQQREELEARARGMGLGQIHFLGHREDIGDTLRAIDVVVMPSRHEGLPLILLEAMAAGRPIVASAVGGIPEVVENGRSALLVPPGSVDALTQATRTVLIDPPRAEALAQTARRVVAGYTAQRMTAQVIAVYRALEAV